MDRTPFFTQTILNEADEKDLEFILNEARDRLKSTMDIADNLTNRSMTIFSFGIAALTTAIGYVATHFQFCPNTVALVPIIFILWTICSILKKNIEPNDYFAVGADPVTIVVDGMFSNLQERRPKWHLMVHLIDAYNERIIANRKENESKSEKIKSAMRWIYGIPTIALIVYLLFLFFPKLFC